MTGTNETLAVELERRMRAYCASVKGSVNEQRQAIALADLIGSHEKAILAALSPPASEAVGEAVERVAEVLFDLRRTLPPAHNGPKWRDIGGAVKEAWRKYARAALAAKPDQTAKGYDTGFDDGFDAGRGPDQTALLHKFALGERVTKPRGSSWTGCVVGFYSTALTPIGYAVESENEPRSVQIYPEAALTRIDQALADTGSRYANSTSVSVSNSRAEIERILERYGADQFISGWSADRAVIGFSMEGRQVRFALPMPSKTEKQFTHHSKGPRTPDAALKEWEQACRQRWRALALVIKAKLEAVESKIAIFEDEFMANIVLPGGRTVSEEVRPRIAYAYEHPHEALPPLLPDYSA